MTPAQRIAGWLPIVGQLSGYNADKARGDLIAGLTTAVLLVPQSMAYAALAGLNPIVGLYASTLPLFAYALVGSSPHLSVGPVALMALVIGSALPQVAAPGTEAHLQHALALALLVGAMQLVMAGLRLGFVVDFLAHPVVVGFSAAAALVIAASQLSAATGVELPRTHRLDILLRELSQSLAEVDLVSLGIFGVSLAFLLLMKRLAPRFPRALCVFVATSVVVAVLGLHEQGLPVVGHVPSGLPALTTPTISLDMLAKIWPAALTALLVGFAEAYSIANVLARGERDIDIRPNRELLGLGLANVAASCTGGCPVGGALSRSTVAASSGARTNLALIVSGLTVVLTLAFLTPTFQWLPNAALAAIIVAAVAGLVNVAELQRLFKVARKDFGLAMVTIVGTLSLGVKWGVLSGVVASLILFLRSTARPAVVPLRQRFRRGRNRWTPEDEEATESTRGEPTESSQNLVVLRVQAPLFFANARYLQDQVRAQLVERERMGDEVHSVIVDATAIDSLDASAELALQELEEELSLRGIQLHLARLPRPSLRTLQRSGLAERLRGRMHRKLSHAVRAAQRVHARMEAAS